MERTTRIFNLTFISIPMLAFAMNYWLLFVGQVRKAIMYAPDVTQFINNLLHKTSTTSDFGLAIIFTFFCAACWWYIIREAQFQHRRILDATINNANRIMELDLKVKRK